MIFGLNLAIDFFDLSLFVDQKGHAVVTHVCSPHELFLAVGSIAIRDLALGVRQQTKRQIVLLREFLMGLLAIQRNSQHFDAAPFELCECISERASLFGAAGRVVFRVKIEYDLFASQVFQTRDLAGTVGHGEIRSFVSLFEFGHCDSDPIHQNERANRL
jgi:hypothetical protein